MPGGSAGRTEVSLHDWSGYVRLGGGGISAAAFPVMDSVLDAGGWFQLSRFSRADPNRWFR